MIPAPKPMVEIDEELGRFELDMGIVILAKSGAIDNGPIPGTP